ncbi:hypothetical protein TRVA0_014S02586 [Trichomonascus vanleenenianus]|uniref:uncharacterized protein n=1 Tax=Trichomonascus vanleenenianus TaxID=2268995 RepID=UPI003ECA53B4
MTNWLAAAVSGHAYLYRHQELKIASTLTLCYPAYICCWAAHELSNRKLTMASLPSEVWFIVLEYLREYDYNIDSQLWRVRPVSKTLAALADNLIWTNVSLACHTSYPSRARKRTAGDSKFSLLDVVKMAYSSLKLAGCDKYSALELFLEKIETQAYKANFLDRYNMIHHIRCANRLIEAHGGYGFFSTDHRYSNEVIRALSIWWENRDVGVNAIAEALAAPYHGYARPRHCSNEIRLRNVHEGFDIIRRNYNCIKHVKLDIGRVSSIGKKQRFKKIISEIAENSKLLSVEITILLTYKLAYRANIRELTKILSKFLENPPRELIIDVQGTLSLEVAQVLNKFPHNVTQLTIKSNAERMGPVSNLTANLVSLSIRSCSDIAQIQKLVIPHKSLCRLFLEASGNYQYVAGKLNLPDTITHLTIVKSFGLAISGNHLKSLVVRQMVFSPGTFLFPELEYLSICEGRIHGINGHHQAPYPKLKALECDNLRDVIQLLELKPSHSVASQHHTANLRDTRDLLFSKYLPPVVTLRFAANKRLLHEDLYFFQLLLEQPSTSKICVTFRYLDINNPPNLTGIAPKYRTLVASSLKQDEDYFQDTYEICSDFVDAHLPY